MEITHRIADIVFRTQSDVLIPHINTGQFARFSAGDEQCHISNQINQLDPALLPFPDLDSNKRERLMRSLDFVPRWIDNPVFRAPQVHAVLQRCLVTPELVNIELAWNRAIIRDFARNEYYIFYPPVKRQEFSDPFFIAGYRHMLANFLPNFSAVMIHSTGILRHSDTAVFLAPDEGGKTTVTRLSNGCPILSDDHLILRRNGQHIAAHGTPLGAITDGPLKGKVSGLFLLEKAQQFELIPIKPRELLQFIWNEHKIWVVLPKSLRITAFNLLYDACHQAPTYRMRFPKDYVDWDAIDAAMG